MIQLYKRTNTDFASNGDFILSPESCDLTLKLNSTWELKLILNKNNENIDAFNSVKEEAVLMIQDPWHSGQLYRIYKAEKTMFDVIAYAYPIFLDAANDTFLADVRPTAHDGQKALDIILSGTKYTGKSNITKTNTAYYQKTNVINALMSNDDNSFLNRWGGEILYNNFEITINDSIGKDRGYKVMFGKNLQSIEEEIDTSSVVTRIRPEGYNGYHLDNWNYLDSPYINKYAVIHDKVISYSDVKLKADAGTDDEESIVCDTIADYKNELKKKCRAEFANGIDKPKVTYTINFVELSQTEEYKDYQMLERVYLGDTVTTTNEEIDIDVQAKVVEATWDCINLTYKSMKLGSYQDNYITNMSSVVQSLLNSFDKNGNLKGTSISGVIDLMKSKLKASHEIAKKQEERAILFEDKDPDSPTFGAMALGTTGFMIASSMDMTGDWDFRTFGTGEGFLADCIIAGVLYSQNFTLDHTKDGMKIPSQGMLFDLNEGYIAAKNFLLAKDGTLTATNADIKGKITSHVGVIGGWVIGSNYLTSVFEDEKNGMIYKTYLQPYQDDSKLDTWVISSLYKKKGESGSYSYFRILANGDAFFKNLTAREKITCKDLEVNGSMKISTGTTIPGTVSYEGIDVSGKVKCKTLEVVEAIPLDTTYFSAKENASFEKSIGVVEDVSAANVYASGTMSCSNLSVSNAFTGSIDVNGQRLDFRNGIAIKLT